MHYSVRYISIVNIGPTTYALIRHDTLVITQIHNAVKEVEINLLGGRLEGFSYKLSFSKVELWNCQFILFLRAKSNTPKSRR